VPESAIRKAGTATLTASTIPSVYRPDRNVHLRGGTDDQCKQFEKRPASILRSKDADAVRAANAYGKAKADNGVIVRFADKLGDRGGTVSRIDTGLRIDPNNSNKFQATLAVTIQSDNIGSQETIAHEGGHVADYQMKALRRIVAKKQYQTDYTYDALDSLTQVTQSGGPSRTFTYDSFKRLLSATNPESGQTGYTFYSNGNVRTKTDARNMTINYGYDAVNRLLSKNYDLSQVLSGQTVAATPNVAYAYDQDMRETHTPAPTDLRIPAGRKSTSTIFRGWAG
jgi:YD repeat-containing protein